jgi:predicted esterase
MPGSSKRTLLLLHGTGGNERDLIPLGREIDPTAAFLSPRGKVLENGMPRFFRRLAEGIFDEEDLKRRTHELADFVGAAVEQYELAADQVIAVGYSNGANIAGGVLLLRPETLRAAILLLARPRAEAASRRTRASGSFNTASNACIVTWVSVPTGRMRHRAKSPKSAWGAE